MKVLDPDFGKSVAEREEDDLYRIDDILNQASTLLMQKMSEGKDLSVREVAVILDSVRKWKADILEQRALAEGRRTSSHGHLHADLCPNCRRLREMSMEELDASLLSIIFT
jgi:hypothetical protein